MNFDALKMQYQDLGYLVVENLIPNDLLTELKEITERSIIGVEEGLVSGDLLDIVESEDGIPQLRRIVSPEKFDDTFDRAMRFGPLVDLVSDLLGGTVRFDHGKLNFKPPSGGAAVEWHQDWAFYPQTNDDMLAVGIMLEDCTFDNGPLMVVPGSHKGPVYNHHQNGSFVGGISADQIDGILDQAVPLTAPAGSISIHHVRTLHGSTPNQSQTNRPLLLFNYVAVDAFPIFHTYEWEEFNDRILRGQPTFTPRLAEVPVRIHAPTPPTDDGFSTGSLFDLQEKMAGALYSDGNQTAT